MGAGVVMMCAALLSGVSEADAQIMNQGDLSANGAVIYSLPKTVIVLQVEAEVETYVAGPYAKYAQRYFGVTPPAANSTKCNITGIKMLPYVEADMSTRAAVNLGSLKGASANFLAMCSQGLIITSDSYGAAPSNFRFPAPQMNPFASGEQVSTIDNITTTIYKSVKNDNGEIEQVPIQQSQVVEKNIDKRAEETAALIFKLRQRRIDIVTGETDATFSGEAMASTLAEIARLENEYMSMFIGKSSIEKVACTFEVVPDPAAAKQMYVAFRVADTGVVPANNMGGRPIVVELTPEKMSTIPSDPNAQSSKNKIYYRVPCTAAVKVMDGTKLLLSSRLPIYQLGQNSFIPVDALIK